MNMNKKLITTLILILFFLNSTANCLLSASLTIGNNLRPIAAAATSKEVFQDIVEGGNSRLVNLKKFPLLFEALICKVAVDEDKHFDRQRIFWIDRRHMDTAIARECLEKTLGYLNVKDEAEIHSAAAAIRNMIFTVRGEGYADDNLIEALPDIAEALRDPHIFRDALYIESELFRGLLNDTRVYRYTWECMDQDIHGGEGAHMVKAVSKSAYFLYKDLFSTRKELKDFVRMLAKALRKAPSLKGQLNNEAKIYSYFSLLAKGKTPSTSQIKCIVVDADGVLWGGILGEDGLKGIQLTTEHIAFQKELLALKRRGFLLAINSKNDPGEIEGRDKETIIASKGVLDERSDMILRTQDFAVVKANWQDKARNLKEIAKELNIGLDSLLFLDDSIRERELARRVCPEVLTPDLPNNPENYVEFLQNLPDLQQESVTDEDRRRTELYEQQRRRDKLRQKSFTLEDYYRSLETKVVIREGEENSAYIPRVAQLTQRTNQFNLTGRRYSEKEIQSFLNNPNYKMFTLELMDKFGNDGVVGLIILNRDFPTHAYYQECYRNSAWKIDTFCLSCRAISRTVEVGFIAHIIEKLKKEGIKVLIGEYKNTGRNRLVRDLYEKLGFLMMYDSGNESYGQAELEEINLQVPEWITVLTKDKNLSRGEIDEIKESHHALDKAANDGRMFAVKIDEVDILKYLDKDELASLFLRNLKEGKSQPAKASVIKTKLLEKLKDPVFKWNIISGFEVIKNALKDYSFPQNKPTRLCIVCEEKGSPAIVYKDNQNNLIAHSGKGKKTHTQYLSIYVGYNLINLYCQSSYIFDIKKIVLHEAEHIIEGTCRSGDDKAISKLYDNVLNVFKEVKSGKYRYRIEIGSHQGNNDNPQAEMETHTTYFFNEVDDIAEELRTLGIQCDTRIEGEGGDTSLTRHYITIDERACLLVPLEDVDFVNNYLISRQIEVLKGKRGKIYKGILGKYGPAAERAVPILIKLLQKQKEAWLTNSIIRTLGKIGPSAKAAVSVLTEMLEREGKPYKHDDYFIANITKTLSEIGPAADEALPVLRKLQSSYIFDIKKTVTEAINKIEASLTKLRAYRSKVNKVAEVDSSIKSTSAGSSDVGSFLKYNIVPLGIEHDMFPNGKKDSGFIVFEELGLDYPSGVVISSELAKYIYEHDEIPDSYIQFIVDRLQELGIEVGHFPGVAVRSDPVISMPGRLETIKEVTGKENLINAIRAVAKSWYSKKAKTFRKRNNIPESFNMNIIIQRMVPVAEDPNGVSGIFSTRDFNTGKDVIRGRYIKRKTGDCLMTKGEPGDDIHNLGYFKILKTCGKKLEKRLYYPQEIEFVFYHGRIYFLQTRDMKFSPHGEIRFLKKQVEEGKLKTAQVIPRLERLQQQLGKRVLFKVRQGYAIQQLFKGLTSTPGAIQGIVIVDPSNVEKFMEEGKPIIFLSTEETREIIMDYVFRYPRVGLITTYGSDSSHEAVLTRASGIPSIINAQVKVKDNKLVCRGDIIIEEGDEIVLDGNNNVALVSPLVSALEVDNIINDASYGIDMPEYRQRFMAVYLTGEGKVKESFTYGRLLELMMQKISIRNQAEKSGDEKKAFIAEFETHLLHILIYKKGEEMGKIKKQMDRDIDTFSQDMMKFEQQYNVMRLIYTAA